MKSTDGLMHRLALADPAKNPTNEPSDANETSAGSSTAQALLHRIQAEPTDSRPRANSRARANSRPRADRRTRPYRHGRRLALGAGILATAAAAAVTVAGVVIPGSHGKHAASAYAIEQNADGSLKVTVHFDDLRDPSALNQELADHHAHTVVMQRSAPGACASSILTDPAHSMILRGNSVAEIQAERRLQSPWLTQPEQPTPGPHGYEIFTIHPALVPAGDQILVMYSYLPTQRADGSHGSTNPVDSEALSVSNLAVLSLPSCVPAPEDQVVNGRTGQIRPR